MASRNEVLTLFGATPEQIMAKQRQEQLSQIMAQQDPFAKAGSALGFGLARLFGGESADVLRARELESAKQGLDLSSAEGMTEAAKRLQAAGFEDRALQLLDMADRKTTAEQARNLQGKEIINKTITGTVTTYDPVSQENVERTVRVPIPHMYDMKTNELTVIFDEKQIRAEMQAAADSGAGVKVDLESENKAEVRTRTNLEQALINLQPGEKYELPSGKFVRKLPNGSLSQPMTRDEMNRQSGIDEQARVNDIGA